MKSGTRQAEKQAGLEFMSPEPPYARPHREAPPARAVPRVVTEALLQVAKKLNMQKDRPERGGKGRQG